jgi:acetyl esterase/lipase
MYDADVRVWYGPESYQSAIFRYPTAYTLGVTAPLPCIVYRPGGGWAGADPADLDSRVWWGYGLNDATNATHAGTYVVFILQTASVGYNRAKATGLTAWVVTTAYALGDYRGNGGRLWVCIDAHTSAAADEPGVGVNWADYWREIGRNETGQQQVSGQGELTPGGLDEAVTNVQQFIGWLRRNATAYGVNPDRICIAGASAGGQLAGCAAYAEDIPWSRDSQVYGASRMTRYHPTQPNAALLSWTPVDLTRHTTYQLLNGLYGEDSNDANWVARPDAIKKSMSPLFVLKRTGLAIPTCLDYLGQGTHTLNTFTGLTGSPYHHPDNGGLLMQYLAVAPTTGLGQTGHRFFDDASAGVYRYRDTYTSTTVTAGTSADPRTAASLMLAWLNTNMPG